MLNLSLRGHIFFGDWERPSSGTSLTWLRLDPGLVPDHRIFALGNDPGRPTLGD
jgi:hypothetical protein